MSQAKPIKIEDEYPDFQMECGVGDAFAIASVPNDGDSSSWQCIRCK